MAQASMCAGNVTYDIVAAYMKNALVEVGNFETLLICDILPIKKQSFDGSKLVCAIKNIANRISCLYDMPIQSVIRENMDGIITMTDPESRDGVVRGVFNEMMRNWLKDDGHKMCWERVIMVIDFTKSMIFQSVMQHGSKCKGQIESLVGICVDFIDNHMYTWIMLNGGWNKILEMEHIMMCLESFDIPDTSVHLPMVEETSTLMPPGEPQSSPENEVFDILCAFVKYSLERRRKGKETSDALSNVLSALERSVLQPKESNYCRSKLLKAMEEFADHLLSTMAFTYSDMMCEHKFDFATLTNSFMAKINANQAYNRIMLALFVSGSRMNWARVIMLMEVTTEIIFQLAKNFGANGFERMLEIMNMCSEFMNRHMAKWIAEKGGWWKIAVFKDILLCQTNFDIESSATLRPERVRQWPRQEQTAMSSEEKAGSVKAHNVSKLDRIVADELSLHRQRAFRITRPPCASSSGASSSRAAVDPPTAEYESESEASCGS